ncbi:MAG: hypothetical protein PHU81_09440 [Acidobacteriota bacterium]|nr:hypothetical protein [Acidobacteriota bacterium]
MKVKKALSYWLLVLPVIYFVLMAACSQPPAKDKARLFKEALDFFQSKTQAIILSARNGRAIVVVNPDFQGRVMTSTAKGLNGLSFGWTNHEVMISGRRDPHMNAFGGEDRFWLGPEGGQFSLFFKASSPFDLDHWFTPPPLMRAASTWWQKMKLR